MSFVPRSVFDVHGGASAFLLARERKKRHAKRAKQKKARKPKKERPAPGGGRLPSRTPWEEMEDHRYTRYERMNQDPFPVTPASAPPAKAYVPLRPLTTEETQLLALAAQERAAAELEAVFRKEHAAQFRTAAQEAAHRIGVANGTVQVDSDFLYDER